MRYRAAWSAERGETILAPYLSPELREAVRFEVMTELLDGGWEWWPDTPDRDLTACIRAEYNHRVARRWKEAV